MKEIDWLRDIPLLSDFSDQDLESLTVAFHREDVAPATILFRQGEPGDRFALLLRGEVEIIQALGTSEERLLAILGPGDFLGEMSLIDPSGLRSASARARDAIQWAHTTQQEFTLLLERQPTLALRLLQEMIRRLRRSEAVTIRDLKEKNQALAKAYEDLQRAQSALIEKEKLEHELEIARVIQKSILPEQIPNIEGWQIAAHWQPARAVSGDFYDIFSFPEGRLGFLIADVSGKGVPAALVMAIACSMLRAAASSEISPGALLEHVNLLLCPYVPRNMFVTCLYGDFDPASGILRFANAGHNLPVKITAGGVQELRATGMPLGLLPGMTYQETQAQLQPGEGLLLFTDGMVEAHNGENEMFGLPRLYDRLAEGAFGPETIDYLCARLAEFTGPDWEQEDDVTFVVITRSPVS
jgi:serine phosphatase RsbU (regulator of sigma subunit)